MYDVSYVVYMSKSTYDDDILINRQVVNIKFYRHVDPV